MEPGNNRVEHFKCYITREELENMTSYIKNVISPRIKFSGDEGQDYKNAFLEAREYGQIISYSLDRIKARNEES